MAGLLAAFLLAPFAAGLPQALLADWAGVDTQALARAGLVSVASATLATALVALGGIPLGYVLARTPGRAAAALGFAVQLPLALPPLASGVLLLFLLGYSSPLGRLSGGRLTDSFIGIVLAEAFVSAPFLIVAARSAFAAVDPVLEDVAATLGHRPGAVFRHVSLPGAARGIGAGMLLAWLRAFGEFGATVMVAYHPYSLPVYTYVAFGSEGLPATLPILLPTIAIAAAVMALSLRIGQPRPFQPRPFQPRPRSPAPPLPPARPPARPSAGAAIAFAFRRSTGDFTLDVAWRTGSRRLGILGASGSGKSATLRLLAGLDRAERASFTLGGRDLAPLPPQERGLGYVPQAYGLLPHLTVRRQVLLGTTADPTRAAEWLARLGLAGLEGRFPAELSLGQQQRVALARALCCRTTLLLLDEPFAALDTPLRARLQAELLGLQAQFGAATILVTHDPAEAMLLADELLLLQDGHVLRSGAAEDVFLRPGSEAAARLLGAGAAFAGQTSGRDAIGIGDVRLPVAGPDLPPGPIGWAVRPDAVQVDASRGLPGTVLAADPVRAGRRVVTVRLGGTVLRGVAAPGFPAVRGPCRVSVDPAAIQVWPTGGAAR